MNEDIAPGILEKLKRDLPALVMRVRDGNEKCIAAWLAIHDYEDDQKYNLGFNKIMEAQKKLDLLCVQLRVMQEIVEGKAECLYILNGRKVRKCQMFEKTPAGKTIETGCWICTSYLPYWMEEWSSFTKVMAEAR